MIITVEVKTRVHEEGVEKIEEGAYIVRVKAPRRKGKANAAVLRLLRKYFGRPVHIVRGHTSHRKIVEVEDDSES